MMLQKCSILFLAISACIVSNSCSLIGQALTATALKKLHTGETIKEKLYSVAHPGNWLFDDISRGAIHRRCIEPPKECPNRNITFWFYTRKIQQYPVEVDMTRPESLRILPIVKGAPWKILVHGYTNGRDSNPNPQLRNAFFKIENYNILTVDYSELTLDPCYLMSTLNIPLIANCTAQMLDALISMDIIPLEEMHVISLSMGVHVAGNIQKYLKSGQIPHLTGLEPAMIASYDPIAFSYMASPASARFFDAIHTDAGFYGLLKQVGHVDFWVNGGSSQPGCTTNRGPYYDPEACEHFRSVRLYAESIITTRGFWAIPCKSKKQFRSGHCKATETNQILMGIDVPHTAKGNYYLTTNAQEPFARGRIPPNA